MTIRDEATVARHRVARVDILRGVAAVGVVIAGTLISSANTASADWTPCVAPKRLVEFDAPLPVLTQAMRGGRAIKVVALGSSSTEGSGASGPLATYPARLDRELDRRFPGLDFQVANHGKGGELASHMLMRISRDVIAQKPALVLWQTGVNDAIVGVDLIEFRSMLEAGISLLRTAGIDVVLVDHQYYPRSASVPRYAAFLQVIRLVARSRGVPVFKRYDIMRHLISSGQHTVEALLSADKFHMNDRSYSCVADLLADAISEAIRPTPPPQFAGR